MNTTDKTSTTHTPGPWETRIAMHNDVPAEFTIYAPGSDPIGKLYGNGFETEANARLIAASPEMLAMLREAKEYIEDADDETSEDLARRCREVIRRATGVQP